MRLIRSSSRSTLFAICALVALLAMPAPAVGQDDEAAAATDSAASTEAVEDPGTAELRFMLGGNSCAISYFVDGEPMTEALHEGVLTDFVEVPAGERNVQVYCAGSDPTAGDDGKVVQAPLKLKAGSQTTLSTMNGGKGPFGIALKAVPNKPKPKAGQARLRVVNLCQECGPVDVVGKGKPIAKKLGFKKAGKYQAVAPGSVKLVVKPKGGTVKKLKIDPFELEPNTASTLFLTMSLSDGTFTPVIAPDGDASGARFVNASREPTVVDVLVDGKKVAKRLFPGQATPKMVDLLAGEHLVTIVDADAAPDAAPLMESSVDFPVGAAVVEAVAGESLEAMPAPMSRAPKPEQTQIRFAHIDPEIPAVDIELRDMEPVLGLSPGEWTEYMTVPGDSSYVWIRSSDDPMTVYHEMPLDLGPGENVTAYLGGSPAIPSVDFVIVTDSVAKKK